MSTNQDEPVSQIDAPNFTAIRESRLVRTRFSVPYEVGRENRRCCSRERGERFHECLTVHGIPSFVALRVEDGGLCVRCV